MKKKKTEDTNHFERHTVWQVTEQPWISLALWGSVALLLVWIEMTHDSHMLPESSVTAVSCIWRLPRICEMFICLIFTCQCGIVWVTLINQVSRVAKEDKSLPRAKWRLFHHNSDYVALDGMWREFISGVISFLKANEFPDNKMVGQSQGLVIGKGNHVFFSAQTEQPQIVMIAGRFLRRKTFPWRHLTWMATVHFSRCTA